jgi:hypothetical protein
MPRTLNKVWMLITLKRARCQGKSWTDSTVRATDCEPLGASGLGFAPFTEYVQGKQGRVHDSGFQRRARLDWDRGVDSSGRRGRPSE